MDSLIVTLVLLLTIIIGIEAVKAIVKIFYSGSSSDNPIVVIPVKKNEQSVENKIRRIIRMFMWNDNRINPKILLLNIDADDETLAICRKICEEEKQVELCNHNTICGRIENSIN